MTERAATARRLLRYALLGALAFQVGASLWHQLSRSRPASLGERLTADTEARIHRTLGEHAQVYDDLIANVPPAGIILWRLPMAGPDVERIPLDHPLKRLAELGKRLRHLVYPERFMTFGLPDAIGTAETQAQVVGRVWLLSWGPDDSPAGREGWRRLVAREGYELWQFPTD